MDNNKKLDFNDELDDILPWEDELESDLEVFDDAVVLLDDEFDNVSYGDIFLSYLDPTDDATPEFIATQVSKALEEYTLDELLEENEMEAHEALAILYELGYVGLPEFIEENEEVQDRETDQDDI